MDARKAVTRTGLVFGVLLAGLSAACAAVSQTASEAPSRISPEADGVRQMVTTAEVAAWGRRNRDPGAAI